MHWLFLLILCLLLGLVAIFKNYLRAVFVALQLPGPPALPFLGNVLILKNVKEMMNIGDRMGEIYGPVMRTWVSIVPFFFISEPHHLQLILSSSRNSKKNMVYSGLTGFIGDGLITNSGAKWKLHRKLIQTCFRNCVLQEYLSAFHECAVDAVKFLENQKDVNVVHMANKFAFDVLRSTVLGVSAEYVKNSPYKERNSMVPYRLTRPWLLLDRVFHATRASQSEEKDKQILLDYTRRILEEKLQQTCNDESVKVNLMDMMIDISAENGEFTNEDVVHETSTFMLAGQESVSTALVFSLYFLGKHQDVQRKAMEEIDGIFDEKRRISYEDVAQMKYLEQCIKESLRLCPSIALIARELTEDVNLGKITLPQGSNIVICPYATHRLPYYFPDPFKFDPERFSDENVAKIHSFAYIPFSSGPRNCIGYKFALIELKVVVSEILRNYHVSLSPGHEDVQFSYRIPTMRAKGGVWLHLDKRKNL